MDKKGYFAKRMFYGVLFPAFVSELALAFADIADAVVVGTKVGEPGLAAVGIVTPIYMIYNIIGYGYSIGASVSHARLSAAGKTEKAGEQFMAVFRSVVFLGVTIAILGNLCMGPLLSILGAPSSDEVIRGLCAQYTRPLLLGAPIMLLNILFYDLLRADDNPLLSSVSFVTGCILDLVLNIVFVVGMHMGVSGAAYATLIAQSVSVCIALPHFFSGRGNLHFTKDLLFRPKDLVTTWSLFLIGCATSVRYVFQLVFLVTANNILMAAKEINNTLYTAVFDVIMNVSYVAYSLFDAAGEALQPIASTFYEERDRKSLYYVRRLAMLWGCGCGLVITILVALLARPVAMLFGLRGDEAMDVAVTAIRVFCLAPLFGGSTIILIAFYQAVDRENMSAVYTALRSFIILMPVTGILGVFNITQFFWLFPITEFISFVLAFLVIPIFVKTEVLDNVKVFSYTLENNNRDIGELLPGIVSFCEQNEADDKQTNLVNLIIEEICVSIINQTFTGDEHEYIQVTLSKDPNGEFTMHLRNSAKRFNPFEQKQSMNDEEEDILNSLGFIMVRKKAKEFHYRYYTGYNLLTVVL